MYCTNCGNRTEGAFCSSCGAGIGQTQTQHTHQTPYTRQTPAARSKKPLLIGIIALLVVAVGIGGYFLIQGMSVGSGGTGSAVGGRPADASPLSGSSSSGSAVSGSPSGGSAEGIGVGSVIEFGGYDWRVLEVRDGRALVLSEHILERRLYHNWKYDHDPREVTWEDSEIRGYLNSEFYNSFSSSDRARIQETRISNDDNPWYGTLGGNDTTDKIFLLSLEEVVNYFGDSGELRNRPMDSDRNIDGYGYADWIDDQYGSARVATELNGNPWAWWLRSPGENSGNAALVSGNIVVHGDCVDNKYIDGLGVRPALWLNLYADNVSSDNSRPNGGSAGSASVGSVIEFGGYDWRVLEVRDGRALVLSEHILERRAYHGIFEDITWEGSDIRSYLNGEFYNSFSSSERARIQETLISNGDNPWYGTTGGKDTTDSIFLLSIEEVVRYFGDSGELRNRPVDSNRAWTSDCCIDDRYNSARMAAELSGDPSVRGGDMGAADGGYTDRRDDQYNSDRAESGGAWNWWLRSPGIWSYDAAVVLRNGQLHVNGIHVYYNIDDTQFEYNGVRPALWLEL